MNAGLPDQKRTALDVETTVVAEEGKREICSFEVTPSQIQVEREKH